ncbi:hypothetical protein MGG_18045 [Pyricularia oryzae 70-15]|uniref:Uncharacterized protein n=1 Tax=Pyricularia oryzae (strain 70-15 / ATCC MYA-4617 / FGSC 8958) TaxID=242507 RepID=G5EHW0_PYRO7|nr:uncharacterized protein MGG_18045 [Pyricularia oryzae 70-15]EAQ70771.1 hypothetical protein MGCH7_ch7g178 [Pyricularia oryzae 70-15]EHA46583.1 hypothetical protein MGG_18045 [Pyricularia oryzae 70-15]
MSNVVFESSIPPPSHELSTDDHGIQVASLCTGFKFFQRVFLATSRSNSELKIAQLPLYIGYLDRPHDPKLVDYPVRKPCPISKICQR